MRKAATPGSLTPAQRAANVAAAGGRTNLLDRQPQKPGFSMGAEYSQDATQPAPRPSHSQNAAEPLQSDSESGLLPALPDTVSRTAGRPMHDAVISANGKPKELAPAQNALDPGPAPERIEGREQPHTEKLD